ncbi:unnamed protein product [marine sediment metagenome]|uniref:Uncharacterized protein n=1 Tax=marine sediment metagenome TaxID=412755 RepID=X1MBG6_9ZZZZ
MEVEIPDELIERAKKVVEHGVRKGYYHDVPADAGIERIFERIVAEDEKRVGWRGFCVPAYCLRFLDVQEHDEVEWRNKEEGVVELRKAVEKEDSNMGIHPDDWRKMDEKDIISSIDVGLTVLHEKDAVKGCSGQLIALIEEIAKMLAREL